jgi:hypothetical protein
VSIVTTISSNLLTHTCIAIDVIKTRIQIDPALKGHSLLSGGRLIVADQGPRALLTGFGPTAVRLHVSTLTLHLMMYRSRLVTSSRAAPSSPGTSTGRRRSSTSSAPRRARRGTAPRFTSARVLLPSFSRTSSSRRWRRRASDSCRSEGTRAGSRPALRGSPARKACVACMRASYPFFASKRSCRPFLPAWS